MPDDPVFDRAPGATFFPAATEGNPDRRLMLWEISGNMHCSIVGTCLDRADVARLMRKGGRRRVEGSTDYEVHSWLVGQIVKDSPMARLTHKHLDRKFEGSLRRHGRLADEAAIVAFWEAARRGQDLAGAYWAILSASRTSEELRRRVFGDVHMMSHFMIGRNRQDAHALLLAEERVALLEERLTRVRQGHAEALEARDARITELSAELARLAASRVERPAPRPAAGTGVPAAKAARALEAQRRRALSARAQLRAALAENERLRRQLALLSETPALPPVASPPPAQAPGETAEAPARQWLYVGGRASSLPHLRRCAERCRAGLLFHDGGIEQTLHGLDDLVARAEMVFCPVDCISHGACLRAKKLCRRLAKPFVPLRSASSSHFRAVIGRVGFGPALPVQDDDPPGTP